MCAPPAQLRDPSAAWVLREGTFSTLTPGTVSPSGTPQAGAMVKQAPESWGSRKGSLFVTRVKFLKLKKKKYKVFREKNDFYKKTTFTKNYIPGGRGGLSSGIGISM